MITAHCCEAGSSIEFLEADANYGPEESGWAIVNGMTDYGAAHTYCNIHFCPWCGKDLNSLVVRARRTNGKGGAQD